MKAQLPLLTVEQLASASNPPPREDWFMLMAYYSPMRMWKLFPDQYLDVGAACSRAENLHSSYTHWQVVRVPGVTP